MSSPVFTERWANPPDPFGQPATVAAGALGTPDFKSGDPDVWTMDGAWADFPQAAAAARPPTLFRVRDIADPTEIICVTNTAGRVWNVIRGDQGSPVTAHGAGFAVLNAITAGGLGALLQGVPSGNGLVLPKATELPATVPDTWNVAGDRTVAALTIPAGEAIPGSVYEAYAWGYYSLANNGNLGVNCRWALPGDPVGGGVSLGGGLVTPAISPAPTLARWRLHVLVNIYPGPVAVASTMLTICPTGVVTDQLRVYLTGHNAAAGTGISTGDERQLRLQFNLNAGAGSGTLLGRRAWRAA